MALAKIRYVLDRVEPPLVCAGLFDNHSGFQRVIPLLPGPGGIARNTARLERVVDREVRRWARDMKRVARRRTRGGDTR